MISRAEAVMVLAKHLAAQDMYLWVDNTKEEMRQRLQGQYIGRAERAIRALELANVEIKWRD